MRGTLPLQAWRPPSARPSPGPSPRTPHRPADVGRARVPPRRLPAAQPVTHELPLQVPAAEVTQVAHEEAAAEVDEQDAGHGEEHVDDGQLQHLLKHSGVRLGPVRPPPASCRGPAESRGPLTRFRQTTGAWQTSVHLNFKIQGRRDREPGEPGPVVLAADHARPRSRPGCEHRGPDSTRGDRGRRQAEWVRVQG